MARVYLKASCGCGFTTEDMEKAKKHVAETGHKMDVFGKIVPFPFSPFSLLRDEASPAHPF